MVRDFFCSDRRGVLRGAAGSTFASRAPCTHRRSLLAAGWLGAMLAFWPSPSVAMWTAMSDAELVQASTLIVMGTWVGQAALSLPGAGAQVQVGVVAVSEILRGAAAAVGPSVVFVAVPNASGLRASSDVHYRKGDSGLWLLRPHPDAAVGLHLADNPQRFVPASTGAARIDTLRRAITAR
jgi:hypothetical protein